MKKQPHKSLEVIGWREWVALPDLGIESVKAKIDTGARTSSLHAFEIEQFTKGGVEMVRFKVHPEQRQSEVVVAAVAPLQDTRHVKASTGHGHVRPVILTTIELLGQRWEVELTLTSRDEMGFRMLLGRQAMRTRFLVDPGKSYFSGRRIVGTRRLKQPTRPAKRKA